VGKTDTMLEKGRRLQNEWRSVVVAIVETHGRGATAQMTNGLEIIPRLDVEHRDIVLTELDVDAVLARRPEITLVNELTHTNAPGSARQKRWEDVQVLLEAGLDVITTVNIQHLESLGDVVEQITGVAQRETVPDAVLRTADQIEVVDLAPQSLRDRLAEGLGLPVLAHRCGPIQLFSPRQPHGPARADATLAGRRGRFRTAEIPRGTWNQSQMKGAGARCRCPHRRSGR
jgi:two-component system sensor histidine kinase KdpD